MDNQVLIRDIRFDSQVFGYTNTINQKVKDWENLIDQEETKKVFALLLKDASEKLNHFDWSLYFTLCVEIDFETEEKELKIQIFAMPKSAISMKPLILKAKDGGSYLIKDSDIKEKSIVTIWNDFLHFAKKCDAYVFSSSSKEFNIGTSHEVVKMETEFFNVVDFLDREFNYKYTNSFRMCECSFWIGKEIYFNKDYAFSKGKPDARKILIEFAFENFLDGRISEDQFNEIIDLENVNEMIANFRVLLY